MSSTGTLFILAAPSGGGKTTLVKRLASKLPQVEISVSHTTRPIRPGEVDGADYYFVDNVTFNHMKSDNQFIEHAVVFDKQYGTAKVEVMSRLDAGVDVLLDIDWQGAKQIKRTFKDAVAIFILPPSLDTLRQRLETRKQDPNETIQHRMASAQAELSHYDEFDYLVVNDDLDTAYQDVAAIVTAQRLTLSRQKANHKPLLEALLATP